MEPYPPPFLLLNTSTRSPDGIVPRMNNSRQENEFLPYVRLSMFVRELSRKIIK